MSAGLSRRSFLERIGQAGGFGAAFLAMQGMGLLQAQTSSAGRAETAVPASIAAAPGSGKGVSVVVLGGGIAGLAAAYELRALGYQCTVLEARERPGGRNWTVRGGDTVALNDGSTQRCTWDAGNYQNFGPARLPSIHPNILDYCKKLKVELQVEVNMTNSAHLQNDAANDGQPVVMRQAVNDTRGHVSELLSKSIHQGALDADLSAADRDRMLSFLRLYGSLDQAGKYAGGDRAGYKNLAGAGDDAGVLLKPIDMHTLLDESFWQGILFDQQFDMQATMFQPVGGMDRIPYAFAKSLGPILKMGAQVTAIRKAGQGARVEYTEGGQQKAITADFCICALPLTILKKIPNDFSAPYRKVIDECTYANAYKVAWESRRFWEQDDNIYGGLEFCNVGCSPIWFPSAGMFSERGVLVSGYTDETELPFGKLALPQKFAESRKSIERLHPGHGHELEKPIYVGWGKVAFNEGSWIRTYGPNQFRNGEPGGAPSLMQQMPVPLGQGKPGGAPGVALTRQTGQARDATAARTETNPGYEVLIQPDGPIVFAGDHVTHVVAWQEGACLSAKRAVQQIADRVKARAAG